MLLDATSATIRDIIGETVRKGCRGCVFITITRWGILRSNVSS